MSSSDIVVQAPQSPALVEEPALVASRAPDPGAAIAFASDCAQRLKDVLQRQNLITRIQGKDHVNAEGWTLLAAMTGYSPRVAWSRKVDADIGDGWEACVELVDGFGRVVSAAEAMALRDENAKWSRQEYSVRSMAMTRATSRAIRLKLGYIVTMAGYSATAAEEMPGESHSPADGRRTPPVSNPVPAAPRSHGGLSAGAGTPTPTNAPTVPTPMEVSHPEHRLHALWRIFDRYDIDWVAANWVRAIKVLQGEGIPEASALADDVTRAKADALIRLAFGVQLESETQDVVDATMAPPDFPPDVGRPFVCDVPSGKTSGVFYRTRLWPNETFQCECKSREKPCKHKDRVPNSAMEQLRAAALKDKDLERAFYVTLALDGAEADDATGDEAVADRAWGDEPAPEPA